MKIKTLIGLAAIAIMLAWQVGAQTNNATQTNEPVVQVKQFRANGKCKIVLGTPGKPRILKGEVLSVYSTRFMFEINDPDSPDIDGLDLIIQKYPSLESLANGQMLVFDAQKVGTIQGVLEDGTPAIGEVLELWDYWTAPVPTPEEIAAAKAAQEKAKADAQAKVAEKKKKAEMAALKFNQDAAAKGDAYGLQRMGERYRDGDGVEKDAAKAKEYLQKAADAGSPDAAGELSKLKQ